MRLISVIIFVSLSFVALEAQTKQKKEPPCIPVNDISEAARAYKDGEFLRYKIHYVWGMIQSDVGEARVKATRKKEPPYGDHFHSVINGETYKFYDLFFKVRDLFEAKFNTTNGRPYYFHRDIAEGRYRMKNTYNYNNDYSIQARVQRKKEPIVDTLIQASECTFDLVSLFYFVRNLDYSKVPIGVNQPISFAIDKEIFSVYYRYEGKEIKKIPGLGHFRTLKFAAKVISGEVFSGKSEIVLWVTDDNNKIPLLFETPIKVGTVTGRLDSFENIKFPLTSKIK